MWLHGIHLGDKGNAERRIALHCGYGRAYARPARSDNDYIAVDNLRHAHSFRDAPGQVLKQITAISL